MSFSVAIWSFYLYLKFKTLKQTVNCKVKCFNLVSAIFSSQIKIFIECE